MSIPNCGRNSEVMLSSQGEHEISHGSHARTPQRTPVPSPATCPACTQLSDSQPTYHFVFLFLRRTKKTWPTTTRLKEMEIARLISMIAGNFLTTHVQHRPLHRIARELHRNSKDKGELKPKTYRLDFGCQSSAKKEVAMLNVDGRDFTFDIRYFLAGLSNYILGECLKFYPENPDMTSSISTKGV